MLLMRNVLISDDDESMREMLAYWFEHSGYRTSLASNGVELLERLHCHAASGELPDLVISDIRMPGMDGLSALSRIHHAYPDMPVVLVTAFGDERTHRRARELGAAAVLDKPFDLHQLRATVEQLLSADPD